MGQSKSERLTELSQEVEHCRLCPLYQGTTHGVPGAGNPDAEIMFIGEAPGFHEDQQGLPFVGRAGQLLNKSLILIGLKREDVYIANMIKHRPPDNRDPLPDELAACEPYLVRQLQIIQPKIVVTLGRFSMNYFLPDAKISRDHGQPRWIRWHGQKVLIVPLFHPAAALRNPAVLKQFNEDIKKLPDIIGALKNDLLPAADLSPDKSADQDNGGSVPPASDQLSLI